MTSPTLHAVDTADAPSASSSAQTSSTAQGLAPAQGLDELAAAWWIKQRQGLDAQQQVALDAWLQADTLHAQAFAQLVYLNQTLDAIPEQKLAVLRSSVLDGSILGSSMLAKAKAPSRFSGHFAKLATLARCSGRLVYPKLAMVFSFVILLSSAGVAAHYVWHLPTYQQRFVSAKGHLSTQQLPDGSQIMLDTDSAMHIVLYRDRREVTLDKGQAMFLVHHNAEQPFHVKAGNAQVTVLGTQFSVRYLDNQVNVAVQEGHVNVSGAHATREVGTKNETHLVLDEAVSVDDLGVLSPVRRINASEIAPWRDGRLIFNNTTLEQALKEFARYSDATISINNEQLKKIRISGSFQYSKLNDFVQLLPSIYPVKIINHQQYTEIASY